MRPDSRVTTYEAAVARGLTPRQIHHRAAVGRWTRLAPAVYLTGSAPTELELALAAALHGGDASTISGSAALRIYGFRLAAPSRELVLVPESTCVASWGRIQVRRSRRAPQPAAIAGDVPLAPVARALVDHAVTLHRLGDAQTLVGYALQNRLCTVEELGHELAAGPRRGSRHLREALIDAGFGAHSAPEAQAGRALRAAGIGMEQNAEVFVGRRRFVADFLDRDRRAILEIDSLAHHYSVADQDATLERDHLLQTAGFRVLHVKPRQVADQPLAFVRLVRAWLDADTLGR